VEWQIAFLLFFGSLIVLLLMGLPVAFSFLLVDCVGMYLLFGGLQGLQHLVNSLYSVLNSFILLPIPLFLLMGDVLFRSGMGPNIIDALDKWIGRIPGRYSILSVFSGTVLAALTGTSLASVAMLGSVLVPEMKRRGYKDAMIIGPILGSGGLAILIPPSALAVIAAAVAETSVSRTLLGIIVPGLILAGVYLIYIVGRCLLNPRLSPMAKQPQFPLRHKLSALTKYVLPQGFVVFSVIGLMVLGIATPSEAAATGCFATVILALAYRRYNIEVIKKSSADALSATGMVLLILAGAMGFSQLLAMSGVAAGIAQTVRGLEVSPKLIIVSMQVIVLILGCLMDVVSIMMITLPIFMPIVKSLGFDPVWFVVLFLLNIEIAGISPPFGMSLFVMKGVMGDEISMEEIYKAALPFCLMGISVMGLLLLIPDLALWLPSLSGK